MSLIFPNGSYTTNNLIPMDANGLPLRTYTATPEQEQAQINANQAAGVQTTGGMGGLLGLGATPTGAFTNTQYSVNPTMSDTFQGTGSNQPFANTANNLLAAG